MHPFLLSALVIFCFMCVMFFIALAIKNNGVADIGWGTGFALVAFSNFIVHSSTTFGLLLISSITIIWGARLSTYLFIRNSGKPEDWRYANWRKEWGKHVVIRSFFQVFMLQGGVMFINLLPLIVAFSSSKISSNAEVFYCIGTLVWLIGFVFESVADAQMYQFKSNPANKGKVMNFGLWRYSRHPNYFGEALLHWGIWLVSIPFGYWYVTIIAPFTITYLLLKVSGVALLEKKYEGDDDYTRYKRNTSSFIPMPPSV